VVPADLEQRLAGSAILRYGLSVVVVAVALGLSVVANLYGYRDVGLPLLALAIAIVTWYAGNGPAAMAVVISSATFNFFFVEPLYTLYVYANEIPYYIVFVALALTIAVFASVRRRAERDLLQARDHLEAANKELESFAYSVSHDLRAPLRHISGYAELLRRQASSALDDKSHRFLDTILESSKRMGLLIDDLLAFSRIGRAEANKTVVRLDQLVDEVVAEVRRDVSEREITWKIARLPSCHGDRAMLRVALVNLISNAVKFTRTRKPAEIEIGWIDGKRDDVEIFVKDNGVGYNMQYQNKLFGVFQRLHLTEEFEGTGIGLATVQRIIQRHGGTVRAEGAVDRGATFYLTLPKAPMSGQEEATTP
jgi:light-regulated signal transduction histidine kinase (bacteriophytochrome)